MTLQERIKQALQGKARGYRGPKGERAYVEVRAADVAELAAKVTKPDPVVTALAEGAKGNPERLVAVQADDAYHLLDQAGKAK